MPATVTTREPIADDVTDEEIKREIELRIFAGAIRCVVEGSVPGRVLVTEWNVIGQND